MAPHLTETVFALGQGDRVVGVGSFCDYPPEIESLPKVGGYIDPDLERITMLKPGLLIVPGRHEKVAEYARLQGVSVLHVHMDSLETIHAGIRQLGQAMGCPEAAAGLRARIQAELDEVRAAVAGRPRPKVLIITGRSQHTFDSLFTANAESFISEVVDAAGGDNVFHDAEEIYFEASKEAVVMEAPEVILEFHAGEKIDLEERLAYAKDWEQLPSLPAVREGRIYLIVESYALRPGPRVGEVARRIAEILHPSAYGEADRRSGVGP